MTGDIEAAGDLVNGALLARAVEPSAGHATEDAPPPLCLNCGTRLRGPHCHRCGQAGHVHRTLGAIGHEIAHGVFHVEGKIWRTLPMLALHPGQLTRRYVDGERVRFVSPLALFLFTVFLLFATISWVGGELAGVADVTPQARAAGLARMDGEIDREAAVLARERAGPASASRDRRVAELERGVAALHAARTAFAGAAGPTLPDFQTGWTRLDHGIEHARANPGLALYKLQSSAYKYSWVLIPLSTPVVALLFLWRRRFGLYDHAVFVTYSLSFMMMLVVALTLAGAAGLSGGWIGWPALLVPPAHLFVQLRGTYGLGRRGAAWRTVALLGFCFAVLVGFATLLLLHGLTE